MKKTVLFSLIAVAVILFAFVSATRATEVVTLRSVIVVGGLKDASTIKLYKPGVAPKITQLDKINDKESFDIAMTKVNEAVNALVNEGYEIVDAQEYGGGASVINTYTLKK